MKRAFIFGAGEYDGAMPEIAENDLIIAADGGLDALKKAGISPGLVIGDFDSSVSAPPDDIETIILPVEKDETDLEAAINEALKRGAGEIIIYGGLGGRLDHTLANLQLLAMLARRGAAAFLMSGRVSATALCRSTASFSDSFTGTVSVFAFGGTAEVTETGLKYRLDRHPLRDDVTLGVSNEFTGTPASVTAHSGTALVLWNGGARPEITWDTEDMRLLFAIDTKDYDPSGTVFRRDSARCVTIRDGRAGMIHSLLYNYYKFPGGGIEDGESPVAALMRETMEETGYSVLPSAIREYGRVHRVQKSDYPGQDIFLQENYYYLCGLSDEPSAQSLDDYEREEGFTFEWVEPQRAITINRERDHGKADPYILERDARVLEMLITEGYFNEA